LEKLLAGAEELGNLVVTKTGGNPFHVVQFIQVLQREGLLMHNPETTLWEYDVDRIQREMMVSETVAELLAVKMRASSTSPGLSQGRLVFRISFSRGSAGVGYECYWTIESSQSGNGQDITPDR
jgi:hypothetical protein